MEGLERSWRLVTAGAEVLRAGVERPLFRSASAFLLVPAAPAAVPAFQHQAWAMPAVVVGLAVVALIVLDLIGTALGAVSAAAACRLATRGACDGPFSAGLAQGAPTPR